jgi:hypothetical protein
MNFNKINISQTHIMIACIVIACIAMYYLSTKKETLVNIDHSRDNEIAQIVYDHLMSSKGVYADYHNFLKSIHNTNPNLSDMDTYYKFKALKMINKLSKTSVLEQISGKTIMLTPKVQSIFPF